MNLCSRQYTDRQFAVLKRKIERVLWRNKTLTNALVQKVRNEKNYLTFHAEKRRDYEILKKRIADFHYTKQRLNSLYGRLSFHGEMTTKNKQKTRLVRLTETEYHRLMSIVGYDRWKSLRKQYGHERQIA